MGPLRQAAIRSLSPLRSAARSSLADRRFAKKAPMAVQNSGQASREDHRRLYSRSTDFPKWYRDPLVALDGGHDLCRVGQNVGV